MCGAKSFKGDNAKCFVHSGENPPEPSRAAGGDTDQKNLPFRKNPGANPDSGGRSSALTFRLGLKGNISFRVMRSTGKPQRVIRGWVFSSAFDIFFLPAAFRSCSTMRAQRVEACRTHGEQCGHRAMCCRNLTGFITLRKVVVIRPALREQSIDANQQNGNFMYTHVIFPSPALNHRGWKWAPHSVSKDPDVPLRDFCPQGTKTFPGATHGILKKAPDPQGFCFSASPVQWSSCISEH